MTTDAPEATAVNYLDPLPEHARSSHIRALADACGATMTSAGAGQSGGSSGSSGGSGDGSSGSSNTGTGTGSPGAGDGSTGSSGGSGDGSSGSSSGGGSTMTYADAIAGLNEEQRTAILAEVAKKNGEARTMRQRARAAENALAEGSSGSSNGSSSGSSGSDGSNSGSTGQNGATNGTDGQQRTSREDTRTREQLGRARAQVAASKVESIAASAGFADPEDAVALLGNLSDYVDDDFSVDSDAIRSDVDELLTRKPHLKRPERNDGGGQRRPNPDRSQGSSANGSGQQRAGTVDAGRDLYRSRHKRPGGAAATSSS